MQGFRGFPKPENLLFTFDSEKPDSYSRSRAGDCWRCQFVAEGFPLEPSRHARQAFFQETSMVRSLIATSAAMLFVMGGPGIQRESRNSTRDTPMPCAVACATAAEGLPRRPDVEPTGVGATESFKPSQTQTTCVAQAAAAADLEPPYSASSFGAVGPVKAGDTAIETLPPPTPTQPKAQSPRVAYITALFGAAGALPAAVAMPPAKTPSPPVSSPAVWTPDLADAALEKPVKPAPATVALPPALPDGLHWVSSAVAVADTAPAKSPVETTPTPAPMRNARAEVALPRAASSSVVLAQKETPTPAPMRNAPAEVALPRAGSRSVVLAQQEAPKSDHETLPLPAPVCAVPAEVVMAGPVAEPIFGVFPARLPSGMLTFDAEAVLWISPNRRRSTGISSTGPLGTSFTQGAGDTLGDEHLNRHVLPGARLGLGYWWTADNPWVPGGKLATCGVETRFMSVAQRSSSFTDDQSPTLARPFFDGAMGGQSAVVVAAPGLATGALAGTASESLWGLEANVWRTLHYDWPGTTFSVEGMVGLRYLDLNDGIRIGRVSSFAANPVAFPAYATLAGNTIAEQESFSAQNRFIGGQVGIRGNMMFDNAIVTGQFQLGLGDTNEQINIQGNQLRILANGQSILSQGALLALPSNIGRHTQNKLAAVPELGVKIAVPVNAHVTLGVGLTTLYWSRIARPGDQVDQTVDSRQIPNFPGAAAPGASGVGHPGVPFNQSDLWLMGATFSVEFKW
jgi:hypothetical protein